MSNGYSSEASKLGGPLRVSVSDVGTRIDSFQVAVKTEQSPANPTPPSETKDAGLPSGRQIALNAAKSGSPLIAPDGKPVVPSSAYSSGTSLTSYRLNTGAKSVDNPDQALRTDTSVSTVPGDKTAPTLIVRRNGLDKDAQPVEIQARGNYTTEDPGVKGRYMVGVNAPAQTFVAGASVDLNSAGSNRGEPNASLAFQVSQNTTQGISNPTTLSASAMGSVGPVGAYASGRTNDLGSGASSSQLEVGARVALDNGPQRTGTLSPRGLMVFAQANETTKVNARTGAETNQSDPRVGARVTDLTIANVGSGKISVDAEVSSGNNDITVSGSVQYRSNNGNISAGVEARYKNNYSASRPDEMQALATVGFNFGGPPSSGKPKSSPNIQIPTQVIAGDPKKPEAAQQPPQDTRISASSQGVRSGDDSYPRVADMEAGVFATTANTSSVAADNVSEIANYRPSLPQAPTGQETSVDALSVQPYQAPGVRGLPSESNSLQGIVPAR
jgi:hypothetical protein